MSGQLRALAAWRALPVARASTRPRQRMITSASGRVSSAPDLGPAWQQPEKATMRGPPLAASVRCTPPKRGPAAVQVLEAHCPRWRNGPGGSVARCHLSGIMRAIEPHLRHSVPVAIPPRRDSPEVAGQGTISFEGRRQWQGAADPRWELSRRGRGSVPVPGKSGTVTGTPAGRVPESGQIGDGDGRRPRPRGASGLLGY